MKRKFIRTLCLSVAILLGCCEAFAQGMALNTSGAGANSSAMLDVSSNTQGVLVPRMLQSERNAISNPATGLLIFQTDGTPGFYYNSGTPASPNWIVLNALSNVTTQGNTFNGASQLVQLNASMQLPVASGVNLTGLPAGNLTGTLPALNASNLTNLNAASLSGTLPALNASNLTNLNAANLSGTLPALNGNALTNLNGGNLTANSVTIAKLPAGASGTTFLRGDGTWVTPASPSTSGYIFSTRVTNPGNANTYYYSLNWSGTEMPAASATGAGTIMPKDCTFKALHAAATCRQTGTADNITIKLFKNGVDQTMGFTWAAPTSTVGVTTKSSTTSNNFSVVAGDIVSIQFSQTTGNPIIDVSISAYCE